MVFDFDGVLGCMLESDISIAHELLVNADYRTAVVHTGIQLYTLIVPVAILKLLRSLSLSNHHIYVLSMASKGYLSQVRLWFLSNGSGSPWGLLTSPCHSSIYYYRRASTSVR